MTGRQLQRLGTGNTQTLASFPLPNCIGLLVLALLAAGLPWHVASPATLRHG